MQPNLEISDIDSFDTIIQKSELNTNSIDVMNV